MADDKAKNRERMLEFVRDTLIDVARRKRTWFEMSSSDHHRWRASADGAAEMRRIVALEAAADVFVHLVGEWQARERRPDWLITIAKQAMATFTVALEPAAAPVDSGEIASEETPEG